MRKSGLGIFSGAMKYHGRLAPDAWQDPARSGIAGQ
jgi:hypothetical protein